MNKSAIIDLHTKAVETLRSFRRENLPKYGYINAEHEAHDHVLQREVSRLGQIHNLKISEKSAAAL